MVTTFTHDESIESIGCIGYGFVGSAVVSAFSETHEVFVHDLRPIDNVQFCSDVDSLVKNVERGEAVPKYFVCVPTPMKKGTGECDISIVDAVLSKLCAKVTKRSIAIIKSTMAVGSTEFFVKKWGRGNLEIVFNPEFLTERNAVNDFKQQTRAIFGNVYGEQTEADLRALYSRAFSDTLVMKFVPPREAETCKLMLNTFWAVKVTFANEMFELCKANNINYDVVKGLCQLDPRMGRSHLDVPGFDGQRGFGGVCLPKDLKDVVHWGRTSGVGMEFLNQVWQSNLKYRESHEWNTMVGRAVSE
jgi:nucleotide sugar dehydrogenase